MGKLQSLTIKRILEKHKTNSQDKKLHETIERGEIAQKEFFGLLKKAVNTKPQKQSR